MELLNLTLPTAEENLALDEALLLAAEAGQAGPILRLWEWPSFAVILGAGGKLTEDVFEDACVQDQVPILRRSSGGGTVLLGTGCLCYSLVLPYAEHEMLTEIRPSFEYIGRRVLAALEIDGDMAGISDLTRAGWKFSGNAQQRKRDHLLHHGTLLYDFDVEMVSRYLRLPVRRPEYRGDREHSAFVRNLPLTRAAIVAGLCRSFGTANQRDWWPRDCVAQLVEEKYHNAEWIRKR